MKKFLKMDCMCPINGIPSFPDNYFDLAIVDPPYGININNNIGRRKGDKASNYDKIKWDNSTPDDAYFKHLLRVAKKSIIWGGNYFTKFLPPVNSWLIWHKMNDGVSFYMCEMAWTNLAINCKVFKRYNKQKNRIHPTQKPIWLYTYILENYANTGDLILDTHVGSASSLIACESMGFDYIGFEIDDNYYHEAKNRISKGIQKQLFT